MGEHKTFWDRAVLHQPHERNSIFHTPMEKRGFWSFPSKPEMGTGGCVCAGDGPGGNRFLAGKAKAVLPGVCP